MKTMIPESKVAGQLAKMVAKQKAGDELPFKWVYLFIRPFRKTSKCESYFVNETFDSFYTRLFDLGLKGWYMSRVEEFTGYHNDDHWLQLTLRQSRDMNTNMGSDTFNALAELHKLAKRGRRRREG